MGICENFIEIAQYIPRTIYHYYHLSITQIANNIEIPFLAMRLHIN